MYKYIARIICRSPSICVATAVVLSALMVPGLGNTSSVWARSYRTGSDVSKPSVAQFSSQKIDRALAFEPSADGTYTVRSRGFMASFGLDGVTMALASGDTASAVPVNPHDAQPTNLAFNRLHMTFRNANTSARIEGVDRLRAVTNYFIGDDESKWRTNVPSYAKIKYVGVYPGVDVVFYENKGELEYDLQIAPGANPQDISVEFEGADKLELENGSLLIHTAAGIVRQSAPVIYQENDSGRATIQGGYVVDSARSARFNCDQFDATRPLVIDPVITYATYLGGSAWDSGYALTTDKTGNVYAAGVTRSTNFPVLNELGKSAGAEDVFVAKYASGASADNSLLSSTYIGGSAFEVPLAITMDPSQQSVYLSGYTLSTDFPTRMAYMTDPGDNNYDAFVIRLDSAISTIDYSTYLGGMSDDRSFAIAIPEGANGKVLVTGMCGDTFPMTNATPHTAGGMDAYASVLDTNVSGTASLTCSIGLGGAADDRGNAIFVDNTGNIYIAGLTKSNNFPTSTKAFGVTDASAGNAFVTKMTPDASSIIYSTSLGGSGMDAANGLYVDDSGNAYITGTTGSTDFPTANAFQTANAGGTDSFIAKISTDGATLDYSTYLGGSSTDVLTSLVTGANGKVYVGGYSYSSNFPWRNALHPFGGSYDAVVARIDTTLSGNASLQFSTSIGGSGIDLGQAIAVDSLDNIYLTGDTSSTDFLTHGGQQGNIAGDYDMFLVKISQVADTVGIRNQGVFFLKYSQETGNADTTVAYGSLNAKPLAGDWDGDGRDTVGVYASGSSTFLLRNSNTPGTADVVFTFGVGGQGYIPLAGDWNGDGVDTVGLYNPATSTFLLRNSNTGGPADIVCDFGKANPNLIPIAGDWDGDGIDTIGLYNSATGGFFLKNGFAPGGTVIMFTFGPAGELPIVGDWNGDRITTVGVYDPPTAGWFLRNENSQGIADVSFRYGPANSIPVAGDWDGK